MFTGIVEATAKILSNSEAKIVCERPANFDDLKIGASICVSGVCLTVTEFSRESMTFDVVSETLKKTKLGSLKQGDRINLERAMLATDRFDGHIVQGHAEGTATVASMDGKILTLTLPSALLSLVVPKGSITIDGVSLTVASLDDNRCSLALIPQTLAQTTLGSLIKGESVNIETDIIGRYIRHFLPPRP